MSKQPSDDSTDTSSAPLSDEEVIGAVNAQRAENGLKPLRPGSVSMALIEGVIYRRAGDNRWEAYA